MADFNKNEFDIDELFLTDDDIPEDLFSEDESADWQEEPAEWMEEELTPPVEEPKKAGKKANFPRWADWSMAGMIRLQMEAATMTPAAKPVRERWRVRFI